MQMERERERARVFVDIERQPGNHRRHCRISRVFNSILHPGRGVFCRKGLGRLSVQVDIENHQGKHKPHSKHHGRPCSRHA